MSAWRWQLPKHVALKIKHNKNHLLCENLLCQTERKIPNCQYGRQRHGNTPRYMSCSPCAVVPLLHILTSGKAPPSPSVSVCTNTSHDGRHVCRQWHYVRSFCTPCRPSVWSQCLPQETDGCRQCLHCHQLHPGRSTAWTASPDVSVPTGRW
jgi:hypothetical protein